MTRLDIPYALSRLQEFAHDPKVEHHQAAQLLMRYVKATKDYLLYFEATLSDGETLESVTTEHCGEAFRWNAAAREACDLEVWSDSDWAGDRGSRRSTLSVIVKACGCTIAAKSRKSKLVCLSSCEAELDAAVLAMRMAIDISGLQLQLRSQPVMWAAHTPTRPISLFIDNQAALAVIQNDSRGRNRHFDIRLQFVRYNIDASQFLISYCPSDDNLADGGTKALNRLKQEISSRRILNLPSAARSDG